MSEEDLTLSLADEKAAFGFKGSLRKRSETGPEGTDSGFKSRSFCSVSFRQEEMPHNMTYDSLCFWI